MISSDPSFTDPALAVIKRTDPDTYREIAGDDGWYVSSNPALVRRDSDAVTHIGLRSRDGKVKVFYPRDKRTTVLNSEVIKTSAATLGVSVDDYLAAILVHEFKHHKDGRNEEVPAYRESVRFDTRLPRRDQAILLSDLAELRNHEI